MFRLLVLVPALSALFAIAAPASAQPLDRSFGGGGGRAVVAFDQAGTSARDEGRAVFVRADGMITTVAEVDVPDANPAVIGIGLARLDPAGTPVAGYGGSALGKWVKNAAMTSITDAASGVFGRILVVGEFGGDSALVMFDDTGQLVTSFAGDGGAVWDTTTRNEKDVPTAVAEVDGVLFVAGHSDVAGGAAVDYDAYLGRIGNDGSYTHVGYQALGGPDAANDRAVDLEVEVEPGPFNDRLALLVDNGNARQAGAVIVYAPQTGAQLMYVALQDALVGAPHCGGNPNARSVDLVRLSDGAMAVVGNVLDGDDFPVQAYVITVNVVTGSIVSAVCSPVRPGIVYVVGAAASKPEAPFGDLHLATTVNGDHGYWRWAPRIVDGRLRYEPDATFAAGQPFAVEFNAVDGQPKLGYAAGVAVDPEGRAVVVGTRYYDFQGGNDDRDVALFRVAIDERLFGDSFE